jgi:DNA-binding CsgD family transcriptional regulator
MLVGELVCAKESAILAREDAALAKEGRTRLPPGTAERFSLSLREAEVAELLYARASYKDICDRLFISLPTVKSHISAIYRKSLTNSRREFITAVSGEPLKG